MKRARRAIVLGGLIVLGGALVTVLSAEAVGLSGFVRHDPEAPQRFVSAGGRVVHAFDSRGSAWTYLTWEVWDKGEAAVNQYMHDNRLDSFEGVLAPSYLHCDPPDTLPRWSGLWHPERWPQDTNMGSFVQRNHAVEVATGWPLAAFAMGWDTSRRFECRGGKMLGLSATGSLQVLLWRPIFLGFAFDTLVWSACIALIAGGVRLWVRARRRRRGGCAGCGYDLAGLAPGAVCPECGAAVRVVAPAHQA